MIERAPVRFGELLRQYRLAAGLSQEELAEKAGISAHGISDLERGARMHPYPATVRCLVKALGLSGVDRDHLRAAARGGSDPAAHVPPRTLGPPLRGLPVPLSSFVGREQELQEVRRRLASARLLTLVGPGGIGKTRLGLQVAETISDEFTHGALFVDLAGVADASAVPYVLAARLDVKERPRESIVTTLVGRLAEQQRLLVLDNCEHVRAGCAETARSLLENCARLKMLATSREPLGLPGEVIWRVPSLASPDPQRADGVDDLVRFSAVRLFVERARLVQPDFELTPQNAGSVARLCRELDGIPLALELAAARLGVTTVEQVADRLRHRFSLAAGGSWAGLSRHKTLMATFDWSYELLEPADQQVFRRLAVFSGGWSSDAAEAVCSTEQTAGDEVLAMLEGLVARSMVQVDCRSEVPRYRLLEPVRQYAATKLMASGDDAEARDRHCGWYLGLIERAEPALSGSDQLVWLDVLEREHDNLRAAVTRSLSVAPDTAVRLIAALWDFCQRRSHYAEWAAWAGQIWPPVAAAVPRSEPWVRVLLGASRFAFEHGDRAQARVHAETGVALARTLGGRRTLGKALRHLGRELIDTGEIPQAEACLEEALGLFRDAGDLHGVGDVLAVQGIAAVYRSDYARARALLERGIELQEQVGDRWTLVVAYGYLGRAYRDQGRFTEAEKALATGLRLARELGSVWEAGIMLSYLASVCLYRADLAQAAVYASDGLGLGTSCGSDDVVAANLVILGLVAHANGDMPDAVRVLEDAVALRRTGGHRRGVAEALRALGMALQAAGDVQHAAERFREGLVLAFSLGDHLVCAGCLEGLAAAGAAREPRRAAGWLGAAAALRTALGTPLPPVERPMHAQATAALRAALGAEVMELSLSVPDSQADALGR